MPITLYDGLYLGLHILPMFVITDSLMSYLHVFFGKNVTILIGREHRVLPQIHKFNNFIVVSGE